MKHTHQGKPLSDNNSAADIIAVFAFLYIAGIVGGALAIFLIFGPQVLFSIIVVWTIYKLIDKHFFMQAEILRRLKELK